MCAGADEARGSASIQEGHLDVEDRQVGLQRGASLDSFLAAVGRDSGVAQGAQELDEGVRRIAVVVGDDDSACRTHG